MHKCPHPDCDIEWPSALAAAECCDPAMETDNRYRRYVVGERGSEMFIPTDGGPR